MDIQRINTYKNTFDSIAKEVVDDNGGTIEVWYARELQKLLGYARWENFTTAMDRAIASFKSQDINSEDHFRDATKMVQLGSGSGCKDYLLTPNGYACKELIA